MLAIKTFKLEDTVPSVTTIWAMVSVLCFGFTALAYARDVRHSRAAADLFSCPGCAELLPLWFRDPERGDVWQVNQVPNPSPPRVPWRVKRPEPLYEDNQLRRGQVFDVLACRVCRYKSKDYPGRDQSQSSFERWQKSQAAT